MHITEYGQGGSDRAAYGEQPLPELARRLRGIRGASAQQLYHFRDFYRTYPTILSMVSRELQRAGIVREVPPLETSEAALTSGPTSLPGIAPEVLLSRLSFSHFLELLPLDNALQRAFYEVQAVKNSWSVWELKRAIHSALYERTGLSTDSSSLVNRPGWRTAPG